MTCSSAYKYKKCKCENCLTYKKNSREGHDKELAKERSRVWRLENLERSRENSKKYQKEHPEQLLKWQLKKYRLTLQDHEKLLKRSNDRCEICGSKTSTKGKSRLSIDHDHDTGKVRGLLCNSCNLGIGHLRHNSNLLLKAIEYLKIRTNGDVYD